MPDVATKQRTQQPTIKFGRGGRFTAPLLLDCLTAAGILPENPDGIPDIQPIQDDLLSYLDRIAYLEQEVMKDPEPYSHDSICSLLQFIIYTQPREIGNVSLTPDGHASIEWRWDDGAVWVVFEDDKNIECYCQHKAQHSSKRFNDHTQTADFIKASGFNSMLY